MESKIDERFAYITDAKGNRFQVLKFERDEEGAERPVDWDEAATAALVQAAEGVKQ
jgi:hypothetical protein